MDAKILTALTCDGRMTWAELGGRVGLSAPAAAERVHRLEERGVIRGFPAQIDPVAVGLGLTAFVAVSLSRPQDRAPFLALAAALDEVQECHHIAGDDDYLLKIRCRDTGHLESLLSDRLKNLEGVVRTRTTIVLRTAKETTRVPLAPCPDEPDSEPR
jgi:Lrp/AsnC family leucine-responsive transcriptional regulator